MPGRRSVSRLRRHHSTGTPLSGTLTALDCLRMVAVGELPEAAALAATRLGSDSVDISRRRGPAGHGHRGGAPPPGRTHAAARRPAYLPDPETVAGQYGVDSRVLRRRPRSGPQRAVGLLNSYRRRPAPVGAVTPAGAAVRPPPGPRGGGRWRHAGRPPGHRTGRLVATRTPVPLWQALADQTRGLLDATPTHSGRRSPGCAPPPRGRRWPTRCSTSPTALGRIRARHGTPRTRRLPSTPGSARRATRRPPTGDAPNSQPPHAVGRRSRVAAHGASTRSPPPRSGWPRCSPPVPRRRRRPGPLRLLPHRGHPTPVHIPQAGHQQPDAVGAGLGPDRSTIGR